MEKKTKFELKIMDYYNKNCKDKGLIYMESEKRTDDDSEINLYDYIFQYDEKKMKVTFAEDDEDDDIQVRIKQLLRENNLYL